MIFVQTLTYTTVSQAKCLSNTDNIMYTLYCKLYGTNNLALASSSHDFIFKVVNRPNVLVSPMVSTRFSNNNNNNNNI